MNQLIQQPLAHNESIRIQPECKDIIDGFNQDVNTAKLQNQMIQYIGTLEDPHNLDDRKWFQKLIHNNHHNIESEDIDLGILYNFTYLDTVIAKLLNINIRKIIAIDIIKGYIKEFLKINNQ